MRVAADGVDALGELRNGGRPSLILLDMMMPRLDGEGFMRALRGDLRLAGIPVVIRPAARRRRPGRVLLAVPPC